MRCVAPWLALGMIGCTPEVELARVRADVATDVVSDLGALDAAPDVPAFDGGDKDAPVFDVVVPEDTGADVASESATADASPDASASGWVPVVSGTGSDLRALWGTGPTNVWAVGEGGTALRWDGTRWRGTTTGTVASLRGIWGESASNVWAVGTLFLDVPVVLRWNGTAWRQVPAPQSRRYPLRGVWGERADAVWVAGGSSENPAGPVFRWDGAAWREERAADRDVTSLGIHGRVGVGPWIIAEAGTAFRRESTGWSEVMSLPRGVSFTGRLWVGGADDVWATGPRGAMHHYGQGRWTSATVRTVYSFNAVWASDPASVWAVGFRGTIARWNGLEWSVTQVGSNDLWAVWGSGAGDLWVVGDNGTILRNVR